MEAIERNTPPDDIQISQGAGYDPASHGYSGAINVSFPVSHTHDLSARITAKYFLTCVSY